MKILGTHTVPHPNNSGIQTIIEYKCQAKACGKRTETAKNVCTKWVKAKSLWLCGECLAIRAAQKKVASRKYVTTLETMVVPDRDKRMAEHLGKMMVFLTVPCPDCGVRFEKPAKSLRVMEGANGIRCDECVKEFQKRQKQAKPKAPKKEAEPSGLKVSDVTLRRWNSMDVTLQASARAIVRRHSEACRRLKVPIESVDRLLVEAMEMAKLEARYAEANERPVLPVVRELFRQYDQYSSPKDAWIN